MPLISTTSAKDIHGNAYFIELPTDSRVKGYQSFYVCSQTD